MNHNSWPDPGLTSFVYRPVPGSRRARDRFYRFADDGREWIGVTSVLKALPLGKLDPLMDWAADQERSLVLYAAVALRGQTSLSDAEWLGAVDREAGEEPAHPAKLEQAADLGTAVHRAIEAGGASTGDQDIDRCVHAWNDYRLENGIEEIRQEQVIADPDLEVAGTADLIAQSDEGLILYDFKTAKAIYLEHQVQAAQYLTMARRYAPVERARIVRLPKLRGDSLQVFEIGSDYSVPELQSLFTHAHAAWRILRRRT